jgi:predicted O-methyltransferase YrrM
LVCDLLVPPDPVLGAALEASAAAGLAPINVSPNQGKLLHLLARVRGARSVLEVGTLGGYSTIWLARALPAGGRLITLQADSKQAEVARANIARVGLAGVVELRLGPAQETLPRLAEEGLGPFALTFIGADKPCTPDYISWALRLSRRGSLIVVDNGRRGRRNGRGRFNSPRRAMLRVDQNDARSVSGRNQPRLAGLCSFVQYADAPLAKNGRKKSPDNTLRDGAARI